MVDILEVVKVIRVDVEYDFDFRTEGKETVYVFAGVSYEVLASSYAYVSIDLREISAY